MTSTKFNICPMWPGPTYPRSDLFMVDYMQCDINTVNDRPLVLWYELNGDPSASPFNSILDGSLLGTLSADLVKRLNDKTAYVVINTANECIGPTYTDEFELIDYLNLHVILEEAALKYGIDPTSIIWVTGDLNAEDAYNNKTEINIISSCVFFSLVNSMFVSNKQNVTRQDFDHPNEFTDLAISPNRAINSHRTYMIIRLFQEEILYKLNYSFPRNLHGKTINDGFCDLRTKDDASDKFDRHDLIKWDDISVACLEIYLRELPLEIDVNPNNNTCLGMDAFMTLKEPYQQSLFSILTETNADGGKCFISEALIVAIVMRTPFLLVGNKGIMAKLREWGFHTFDDLFDESYDDEVDDIKRYEMVLSQIKAINDMPFEDAVAIRKSMKQKLDDNFNRLELVSSELKHEFQDKLDFIMKKHI